MTTQLNFINQSNGNTVNVVIFQKNLSTKLEQEVVAWRVIGGSRPDDSFRFSFPPEVEMAVGDSFGDMTPMLQVSPGQSFHVRESSSGKELAYLGLSTAKASIQFRNDLPGGSVNANIYRGGNLLATKTGIAPGQKTSFRFKPSIWIGVVSEIEEGDIMDSAIISQINTQLSLLGILYADIIMTGGGPGRTATPFKFTLANVR